jgi:heme exporter protein C
LAVSTLDAIRSMTMRRIVDTINRWMPWVAVLTALAMAGATGLAFFYAPVDRSMGIVQKIFYTHVPAAMAAYAGFTVTSVASLLYLLKPHRTWDLAAVSGAHLGLLFCAYVLISGPLWGYKAWGKAWVWDPQLTSTFVLFLLYGGYALLRAFSGSSERMRKISAVLAVIAFIDIPIVHYSVQMWRGTHPVIEREGGGGLAPAMKTAFSAHMFAFLLLFVVLLWLAIRVRRTEWRIDELHVELEDLVRTRRAQQRDVGESADETQARSEE